MTSKLDLTNVDGLLSQDCTSSYRRRSKRNKYLKMGPTLTKNDARQFSRFKTNELSLTRLPNLVLLNLLRFLDVKSLENLSATCSFFDQLIAGKYLTSLSIPFSPEFVKEMKTSKSIDRKPLLKLEIGKSRSICLHTMLRGISVFHPTLLYLIDSQLSLLDLRQLREIDLVFNTPVTLTKQDMFNIRNFYLSTLIYPIPNMISKHNSVAFKNITRLSVMMGEDNYAVKCIVSASTNLIELGLHIHARKNLSPFLFQYYVRGLQAVVAASRAPILKLNFLAETRNFMEKKLTSNVVEKLEIEGPCTVNIVPDMKNLREVIVEPKPESSSNGFGKVCTYWKSRSDDRVIHRAGLCCVNLGTTYANCPKLKLFMGVDVSSLNHSQTSPLLNLKLKKRFYEMYIAAGGSKKFKSWCQMRWFSKKLKFVNSLH